MIPLFCRWELWGGVNVRPAQAGTVTIVTGRCSLCNTDLCGHTPLSSLLSLCLKVSERCRQSICLHYTPCHHYTIVCHQTGPILPRPAAQHGEIIAYVSDRYNFSIVSLHINITVTLCSRLCMVSIKPQTSSSP